jgi:hypothetical protein
MPLAGAEERPLFKGDDLGFILLGIRVRGFGSSRADGKEYIASSIWPLAREPFDQPVLNEIKVRHG